MSNTAIILSISKAYTRWDGTFKGLLHDWGWIKSSENLCISSFKIFLLIDYIFSQIQPAEQYL
jgi:hypothetical protein